MNKRTAKKLAKTIKYGHVKSMLDAARADVGSHEKPSRVNPQFTKGQVLQMFSDFSIRDVNQQRPSVTNAIWEFSEYLI